MRNTSQPAKSTYAKDTDDRRPSSCQIMAMTKAEVKQVYDIRDGVINNVPEARKASIELLGLSKKRYYALAQLDILINAIEEWRPCDIPGKN